MDDAATLLPTAPSPAPSTAPPTAASRDRDELLIALRPAAWMSRVRADTSFGGPNFVIDDDFGLNGYEAAFSGELTGTWGGFYEVMIDGWCFSTSAGITSTTTGGFGSVTMTAGDHLETDFAAASAGAEFDLTLFRPFADRQTPWGGTSRNPQNTAADGNSKADLRLKAIASVRWYSATLSVNDTTTAQSDSWALSAVMPGVGGGFDLSFNTKGIVAMVERITIEAAGGVGSNFVDGQNFTFARAGVSVAFTPQWGPVWGVEAGYRLENFTLNNNSAEFDGGVQGLYFGANIKF